MAQSDETRPVFHDESHIICTAALPPDRLPRSEAPAIPDADDVQAGLAASECGQCLSFEEAAEEIGGLPEEIRDWTQSGAVALVDPASARAGRICAEDFRRIEQHQVAVDIQRCFKDPEKFLNTRFERFGDKTPRELLTGDGADLVRDLVWQIKSGANS